MTQERTSLRKPLLLLNPEGEPRRVGVELEMNGFTLDDLAKNVAVAIGANINSRGATSGC